MMNATQPCPSCATPIPLEALECPACGSLTPTDPAAGDATHQRDELREDEARHRTRLQRALGDAYELRELIGRGGFGWVYAAWDVQLEREVAVKILRQDIFPSAALLTRFKREARAVAKLQHPNIVPIYSIGEGDGLTYMIMPRIDGENLKTLMAREPQLPIADVRRMLVELARALAVAHDARIIHRDIKPANIIVERTERRAYLMDFGLAKALEADDGLTQSGAMMGTPAYMSPDQAWEAKETDHRSDIYSLGTVAYELVTGKVPFTGESAMAILTQKALKAAKPIREIRPNTPKSLAAAIERCLQRSPDDRWQSAKAFADALEGASVTQPKTISKIMWGTVATAAVTTMLAIGWANRPGGGEMPSAEAAGNAQLPGVSPPVAAPEAGPDDGSERIGGSDTLGAPESLARADSGDGVTPSTARNPALDDASGESGVTPAFEPLPAVGFLTVDATPYGMVAIDGIDIQLTPLTLHELAPGQYVVSVTRLGFRSAVDTLNIAAGNRSIRTYRLVPISQPVPGIGESSPRTVTVTPRSTF